MFQFRWNNKPLIFLAHYLPYHPGCRFTWPVRDVAALCWPGAIEKFMTFCTQRDLHCHPFPFYLWRFAPPKSWTPCRNKLMKCLSLRVHLLDHLANISPFRKGRDAEQSGPKIVGAHPSKWPQKGQKLNCWCSITGGDGFFESYCMQSYVKSNWWWWCMWLHTPHVGTGQRIYLDHTCAVVIVAWHVGEGVLTL